jgi:hypothetical protein
MPASTPLELAELLPEMPASTPRLTCPFCGGHLVRLASHLRCSRCGFTLCEGCDGGNGEE